MGSSVLIGGAQSIASLLVPIAMSTFGVVVPGRGTDHVKGGITACIQSFAARPLIVSTAPYVFAASFAADSIYQVYEIKGEEWLPYARKLASSGVPAVIRVSILNAAAAGVGAVPSVVCMLPALGAPAIGTVSGVMGTLPLLSPALAAPGVLGFAPVILVASSMLQAGAGSESICKAGVWVISTVPRIWDQTISYGSKCLGLAAALDD